MEGVRVSAASVKVGVCRAGRVIGSSQNHAVGSGDDLLLGKPSGNLL